MTPFRCTHCHAVVFFENAVCGSCGAWLAFDPAQGRMQSYQSGGDIAQPWQPLCPATAAGSGPPASTMSCLNQRQHGNCNWMVDDADQGAVLCRSCRLTRTIPDLSVPGNTARWARIEQAKRRLVYGLQLLGLTPQPRHGLAVATDVDPDAGLCFDLLADAGDGARVKTGHDHGVITLNISEADDAYREAVRVQMGEPLRTLLGHLRHETAHYLQFRWIDRDAQRTAQARAVFGDERADYAGAMQHHYAQGAPADWPSRFISSYASMHPWEDWAETCAHWLLIVDAVQTAAAWGLRMDGHVQAQPQAPDANGGMAQVDDLVLRQWLPIAQFLNAMHRSIGSNDSYPFQIPPPVLDKLAAVQALLLGAQPSAMPVLGQPVDDQPWRAGEPASTAQAAVRHTAAARTHNTRLPAG